MIKLFNNTVFNEKDYYIKGKVVKGIELTEGQQYMLAQHNNQMFLLRREIMKVLLDKEQDNER